MKGSKVIKIKLDNFGQTLRMQKGCFILSDKSGESRRYPLVENEVGEAILQSGNTVSTGALAYLGVWNINTLIISARGQPIATLRNLNDDSHVATRIAQYKATENEKGTHIAKQTVLKRIESQNLLLSLSFDLPP